jgi:hypothetical protein
VKKLLAPFSLFVVLALALSACGASVNSSAATVNGTGIPISQLTQALNDSTSSSLFSCLLSGQSGVKGAGVHGTYSARFTAEQLSLLIEQNEIQAEVAKFHLVPTALATSLAANQVSSGLSPPSGSSCTATGAQVIASLPNSYRNLLSNLQVDQDLLSAHLAGATLTNSGVQTFAAAHPNIADLACVSVILVAKRATATSIINKIASGSSFSALAKAQSIDSQSATNGGALGCVYPGQFSGTLAAAVSAAAVGKVSTPIAFGADYVVLEVTKRQSGTASGDALALVSSQTGAETALVNSLGRSDKVWVNSQYGSWSLSSGQFQVIPASGPPNADIVNPNAVTPLGDTYS